MRRDSPRYGNFPKRRKSRERPWNRASPAFGKLWEHVGKYRVDLFGETLILYKNQKKIAKISARNRNVDWLQVKIAEIKKDKKKLERKK